MKKRLMALLALCMVMVAPAAMATEAPLEQPFYIPLGDNQYASISNHMLLGEGNQITIHENQSGLAVHYKDKNYNAACVVNKDFWYVVGQKYESHFGRSGYVLYVEDTGTKVIDETTPYETTQNKKIKILGFEGLNSISPENNIGTIKNMFASNIQPGYQVSYYNVGAYIEYDNRYDKYQGNHSSFTFTFPLPAVDARVYHIEQEDPNDPSSKLNMTEVPSSITSNGVQVKVNSFSPFMVVWKPAGGGSSQPKTGDESQLLLWFALAGVSLAGMALIAAKRRKRA